MLSFFANDYVQEPTDLLRMLVGELDKFETINPSARSRDWTLALQSALKRLAEKSQRGIEHLCARTTEEKGTGEFLLDAVWWQRTKPGSIENIALAVESEFAGWAKNRGEVATEVAQDFYKLLVVKSPLKLMVFCSWYAEGDTDLSIMRDTIWSRLRQCIAEYNHHIEGETYLFLDTAVMHQRRAWTFTIPRSGSISFEEITKDEIVL